MFLEALNMKDVSLLLILTGTYAWERHEHHVRFVYKAANRTKVSA
jgi:hypothetical protein